MDVLLARLADLAFEGAHERGGLAAHEGAAAARDGEVEVEAGAENVLPEQAVLAGLLDGDGEVHHGQRVLVAHVDEPLVRAHGVGADDNALQHRVRIALHDRAVLERAGVTLVAVAHDELAVASGVAACPPLARGNEPGAAASAQAGALDLADHLLRGQLEHRLDEPGVGIVADGVGDVGWVDLPDVAHGDARLVGVERHVAVALYPLLVDRVPVQQARDHLPARDRLLADLGDVLGLYLRVEDPRGLDHYQRPALAEAVAAGAFGERAHLGRQTLALELLRERLRDAHGAVGEAPRAAAHQDLPAMVRAGLLRTAAEGAVGGSRLNPHGPPPPRRCILRPSPAGRRRGTSRPRSPPGPWRMPRRS